MGVFISDVNKDLTLKIKANAENIMDLKLFPQVLVAS